MRSTMYLVVIKNVCHVSQWLGLSSAFEAYSDFRCYCPPFYFLWFLAILSSGRHRDKYDEIMERAKIRTKKNTLLGMHYKRDIHLNQESSNGLSVRWVIKQWGLETAKRSWHGLEVFKFSGRKPRLGSNGFGRLRFVIAQSCGPVSVSGCGVQEIHGKGEVRRLGYLRLAPSGLAFSLVVYFSVFDT